MSLNKIQIVKSISQDFNGFNSLCYVWGKDTDDNVLVGKEEKKSLAKPGLAEAAHISLESSLPLNMAFAWGISVPRK